MTNDAHNALAAQVGLGEPLSVDLCRRMDDAFFANYDDHLGRHAAAVTMVLRGSEVAWGPTHEGDDVQVIATAETEGRTVTEQLPLADLVEAGRRRARADRRRASDRHLPLPSPRSLSPGTASICVDVLSSGSTGRRRGVDQPRDLRPADDRPRSPTCCGGPRGRRRRRQRPGHRCFGCPGVPCEATGCSDRRRHLVPMVVRCSAPQPPGVCLEWRGHRFGSPTTPLRTEQGLVCDHSRDRDRERRVSMRQGPTGTTRD